MGLPSAKPFWVSQRPSPEGVTLIWENELILSFWWRWPKQPHVHCKCLAAHGYVDKKGGFASTRLGWFSSLTCLCSAYTRRCFVFKRVVKAQTNSFISLARVCKRGLFCSAQSFSKLWFSRYFKVEGCPSGESPATHRKRLLSADEARCSSRPPPEGAGSVSIPESEEKGGFCQQCQKKVSELKKQALALADQNSLKVGFIFLLFWFSLHFTFQSFHILKFGVKLIVKLISKS